jgi:tRNA/rRNA methyltransferase
MGENIGATARAMKNFGLSDLRIVSPRDGWPNAKAHEMSAQADDIIENAKIFNDTESAIADLNLLFATASKSRDMAKQVITPSDMADIINSLPDNVILSDHLGAEGSHLKKDPSATLGMTCGLKIGILFGQESSGLDNEDISHCNYLISIPVSPEYDSLNLAQAVCIIGYELFKLKGLTSQLTEKNKELSPENYNLSPRKDINEMLNFIETEITAKNLFQTPEKKPGMLINIRNIFSRHFYTEQEVRTLRGIFNALKK